MRTFILLNLSVVHNLKIFIVSKYFVIADLKTVFFIYITNLMFLDIITDMLFSRNYSSRNSHEEMRQVIVNY
jgi:hypothetical protein